MLPKHAHKHHPLDSHQNLRNLFNDLGKEDHAQDCSNASDPIVRKRSNSITQIVQRFFKRGSKQSSTGGFPTAETIDPIVKVTKEHKKRNLKDMLAKLSMNF